MPNRFWVPACLAALAAIAASCAERRAESAPGNREETAVMQVSIEDAQKQLTDSVMSLTGVVGTAIGECAGAPCIKVYVARKTEELAERIPSTYDGFPVTVEETGEIRVLDKNES